MKKNRRVPACKFRNIMFAYYFEMCRTKANNISTERYHLIKDLLWKSIRSLSDMNAIRNNELIK